MISDEQMPSARGEAAGDWCRRIAAGSLSPQEIAAFEAWMAEADNRAAFDRASFIWRALDGRAAPRELVAIRMDALSVLSQQDDGPTQRSWWRRGALAAFAASIVALLSLTLSWSSQTLQPIDYATKRGERRVVMLDDGSRLSLDAASEVGVAYVGDRRDLELRRGRAKFDVAKDPLKPFAVAAADKLIVATGTSFSVEILRGKVSVILYEGHVAVLDRLTRKPVVGRARGEISAFEPLLMAGQELSLPAHGAPRLQAIDPARTISWEGGQLSFSDEPLAQAVERMNRYASVKLAVSDPQAARIPISGVFNADSSESFIAGVTGVFPVRTVRRDDAIEFVRKP
jgi:transmembrane sensor